jgi:hypothetical protein
MTTTARWGCWSGKRWPVTHWNHIRRSRSKPIPSLALVDAGLGVTLLDQYTALSANPANVALHDVQPELPFEIQMLRATHRGKSSLVDDMRTQFAAAASALAATLDDRLDSPVVQFDPAPR